MDYKNINDYELIYMIKDGNEYAFEFFVNKYISYIEYLIYKYCSYIDIKNDLVEVGINLLIQCLNKYNDSLNVKFSSFFAISFRREIKKYVTKREIIVDEAIMDTYYEESYSERLYGLTLKGKYFFNKKLHILLFEECILNDLSLIEFSKKYNFKYGYIYYEYKKMIEILKKVVK